MRQIFSRAVPLGEVAHPCQGMATTNNSLFLRQWQEVDNSRIGFGLDSEVAAQPAAKSGFRTTKVVIIEDGMATTTSLSIGNNGKGYATILTILLELKSDRTAVLSIETTISGVHDVVMLLALPTLVSEFRIKVLSLILVVHRIS